MNRSLISMVVMGLMAIGLMEFGRRSLDQAAQKRRPPSIYFEAVEVEVGGRCERDCVIHKVRDGDKTRLEVEIFPFGAFDPTRFAAQVVDALERIREDETVEPTYRITLSASKKPVMVFESKPPWHPRRQFDTRPASESTARERAGSERRSAETKPSALPAKPPGR
ncbi:MAG: hypothetical protein AAF196_10375 [Planctomycetota bacterium]